MKILEATSQQTVQDSSETLPQFYCITLIESNRKGKKKEKRRNNIFDKARRVLLKESNTDKRQLMKLFGLAVGLMKEDTTNDRLQIHDF